MFERFTERARQVVVLSQDEARTLKHGHIGTEHILLGLLREGEGIGARALEAVGVSLEEARERVKQMVAEDQETSTGQIPFTPRAKKVLELSLREALSLGHNYIGTEHILLGVVRESEGVAARVLRELVADTETIRTEVVRILSDSGHPAEWHWRQLARAIDGADAQPHPDPSTLAQTVGDLLDELERLQDGAIAAQDLAAAREITELKASSSRLLIRVERLINRPTGGDDPPTD